MKQNSNITGLVSPVLFSKKKENYSVETMQEKYLNINQIGKIFKYLNLFRGI